MVSSSDQAARDLKHDSQGSSPHQDHKTEHDACKQRSLVSSRMMPWPTGVTSPPSTVSTPSFIRASTVPRTPFIFLLPPRLSRETGESSAQDPICNSMAKRLLNVVQEG